ncbi:MAG: D-alanine--D-alanine ligase, partial [Bacteroidia bacterium]
DLTDIRTGIGLPLNVNNEIIKQPQELLRLLQRSSGAIELQAEDSESTVLIESFVEGREFSCIVVEHHKNRPIALPPTEIKKKGELFDYRS